jgi:hypothetical protein
MREYDDRRAPEYDDWIWQRVLGDGSRWFVLVRASL